MTSIFGPPTVYQTPAVIDPNFPRDEGSTLKLEDGLEMIQEYGIPSAEEWDSLTPRAVSKKKWAEAMVGHLTRRKMELGKIVARFENDVNIKDDGNFINVTFSEGISKEDKDEIKDLITKLFTEINAEPVTIERSDSV